MAHTSRCMIVKLKFLVSTGPRRGFCDLLDLIRFIKWRIWKELAGTLFITGVDSFQMKVALKILAKLFVLRPRLKFYISQEQNFVLMFTYCLHNTSIL